MSSTAYVVPSVCAHASKHVLALPPPAASAVTVFFFTTPHLPVLDWSCGADGLVSVVVGCCARLVQRDGDEGQCRRRCQRPRA